MRTASTRFSRTDSTRSEYPLARTMSREVREQVVEWLRLWHDQRGLHRGLDRGLAPLAHQQPGERVVVNDPAHAVGALLLGHRKPRVSRVDAAPQRGLHVLGDVHR